MTTEEKIIRVQTILNDEEATSALVGVYLDDAKAAILQRMYPWGIPAFVSDVPSMYESIQCRLAERYFLRRGAEGESSHGENNISRTYGSVNDEDLLMEVMQVVSGV